MLFNNEYYWSDIAKFKCLINYAEAIVIAAGPDFSGDIERQYYVMELNVRIEAFENIDRLNEFFLGRPFYLVSQKSTIQSFCKVICFGTSKTTAPLKQNNK